MHPILIAWPMMGGACFTLGLIHLMLWARQEREPTHLAFALTAFSVGSFSVTELMLMQARTPADYGELLRWLHVPAAVMFVSLAVFVRLRFPASTRGWLCWLVCSLRTAATVANFVTGENINFAQVTGLHFMDLGQGLLAAVPEGRLNPWMALGQLSNVLLMAYFADTALRTRRIGSRDEARAALRICGSALLFAILSHAWHTGVVAGLIDAPDLLVPSFMCVVFIMSRELGGDVLRALQLARDLTRTESKLAETERRTAVAVRAAEIGLWRWDAASGELWLSDPGEHILGLAPGEPLEREAFRARMQPADHGRIGRCYRQAVAGDGELRCEFQLRTAEGWRWIALRGQLYRRPDGAPDRTYGIVVDVTEQRRREERFRVAVEASPTAMLLVTPGGRIALANQQAERVFGYARDELLALTAEDLVPARLQPGGQALCEVHGDDAPAQVFGVGGDLRARRKDGSQIPVEIALSPITVDGQPCKLASVVDVSERRRLEAESALQRDELAHLSRVALLAELSGSLAHELNQPLTAILSNAQAAMRFMAMDPPNLEEVRESLVNIVESDKRGGEVIRRLRAMLRKEGTDFRALDLNEVVLDVLRIIRSDLLNRSTEIVLELAPNLPPVHGDSIQLQQVLLNLIMNGCDAMAELRVGRELRVSTRAVGGEGVELVVSDVGRGIPPEQLQAVFAPFVTTKADGMGLGLAVCSTIIDSHQGRLWASNNRDRGASLHVLLPLAEAHADH